MIEGVIADPMASPDEALKNVRMLADVVADAKEGCSNTEGFECIEHKFRRARYGTIIEGEKQLIVFRRDAPFQVLWTK